MKRKAEHVADVSNYRSILKKRAKKVLNKDEILQCFRKGLFSRKSLENYAQDYASSRPYKHSIISALINDELLRCVRAEILEHVHFTPKETDIYRIHQSGDLANLDGLDDAALEKLPSLLRLRDALYSHEFRKFIAAITGTGELSGKKTDMAINVYTPGCHLLCHDDVIGSRRVSYILYLTDPDLPWKNEWGGALRLYPTKTYENNGEKTVTPCPDFEKKLPPAWNQLSFFAVQPGESFHDVEEVYHARNKKLLEKDGGRIRMAISGWYHIPQSGEEGFVEGEEEKWGKNSSLKQLQGHPDLYDFPKPQPTPYETSAVVDISERSLSEADIDFLLRYLAPSYLTPDTLGSVAEQFGELSSVTLDGLLSQKFSARMREYIEAQERLSLASNTAEIDKGLYSVARPPHKHRYLYQQPTILPPKVDSKKYDNPIKELLEVFLPSQPFKLWLELATECNIKNFDILGRRFRRGCDYSLATNYDGDPRLEICLGLTPTLGWQQDEDLSDENNEQDKATVPPKQNKRKSEIETAKHRQPKKSRNKKTEETPMDESAKIPRKTKGEILLEPVETEEFEVGGQEVYMAGDDETEDAAVYKGTTESEDDGVLFSMPAAWNKLSIVLRDSGVLKFVKYVSNNAKGDRWDIVGAFELTDNEESISEDDEPSPERSNLPENSSDEEEFKGFSDSEAYDTG
ncbi:Fe II 2-oxoglutarate-dependent dioxygenase [Blumeria hordei DH14]|uniref:uS12 prolyl 3,4-dihydroxylase n=1 Tax=Blumeria graminis f. sp. hordei (strain DH14) TaxID=546991 RepID=N1JDP1_BLUG1|nr:Fe II 2-oxoglutarate-dependent dioxygenase [Blumeria hordei DH14]